MYQGNGDKILYKGCEVWKRILWGMPAYYQEYTVSETITLGKDFQVRDPKKDTNLWWEILKRILTRGERS